MRSCWWWLTSVQMLSEPTQYGPQNDVQTICRALPYIITGEVGRLCVVGGCIDKNIDSPGLSVSHYLCHPSPDFWLYSCHYVAINSRPVVFCTCFCEISPYRCFSSSPSGVWDRAGGLSDPEAALLREVLQQDQAEQRGWREHRPHHGERTDPGMTLRHFLSADPPWLTLLMGNYLHRCHKAWNSYYHPMNDLNRAWGCNLLIRLFTLISNE